MNESQQQKKRRKEKDGSHVNDNCYMFERSRLAVKADVVCVELPEKDLKTKRGPFVREL